MKKPILISAVSALVCALFIPGIAFATCSAQSGSMAQSCESGVTVYRAQPQALPRITPAQVEAFKLKREQMAQREQARADRIALQQQKLELQRLRLSQRSGAGAELPTHLPHHPHYHPRRGAGFFPGYGNIGFGHFSRNGIILVPGPAPVSAQHP